MLKKLRLLFLTFALLVPFAANAQTATSTTTEKTTVTKTALDPEAVKKLITTLESDTARTEFISNLKMLLDTQPKEETETALAPLTQALGVESFTGRLVLHYQQFLDRNNLKESTIGKIALTIGATLIILLAGLFVRRGADQLGLLLEKLSAKVNLPPRRVRVYGRIIRTVINIMLLGLIIYSYCLIWSTSYNPFQAAWAKSTLRMTFNIGFVLILAAFMWEGINALLAVVLRKVAWDNSTRSLTLMPILRNVMFIVFVLLFGLVLLSEIGINILPLLAGAGIVGVAIGFGAQTMVKDFLSGFTLILEDVMRVGDVVAIGGYGGLVEKITLRKVQLRDYDGSVYTVPFSEIKTVTNRTKDFSMYVFDINVAYKEDTDEVISLMKTVAKELREEPDFADKILDDLEIAGVDRFTDSYVVVKARIKTLPIQQWTVGREFNRRIKKIFDEKGIEIPFPQQVTWNANPTFTLLKDGDIQENAGRIGRKPVKKKKQEAEYEATQTPAKGELESPPSGGAAHN